MTLLCNEKLLLCIRAHTSYSIFSSECTVIMFNCRFSLSNIQIKILFFDSELWVYFNYKMFRGRFLNPRK